MLSALTKFLAFTQQDDSVVSKKEPVVCDQVPTMDAVFDAERYMGTWYEIMHTQNQPFQSDHAKCVTAEYTKLTDDGHFKVYNSSKGRFFWFPRFGIHGDAKCPADEEPGQCYVKFFAPFTRWDKEPNYQVVDTDYENYSIVYSCDEDDMQYLWILSRTPTIS